MISFIDNSKIISFDTSVFTAAIEKTLNRLQVSDQDLSIVIENDLVMKDLNFTFRKIKKTTDVLSFTHGKIDPDTNRTYLGDIVISYDQAKKQSTQKSISIEEEIFYLSIHGILHLLGYDHADADEEKVMFKLQEKLFRDEIIDE